MLLGSRADSPLRPKKSLGQNFLRDRNIARKIVAAIDPQPDDILLEIGPGDGALTEHLVGRVRKLVLVERDRRAVGRLAEAYTRPDVDIVEDNILSVDLRQIAAANAVGSSPGTGLRVAGNIPYNITTPILFSLLEQRDAVSDATIMMQREVAWRLVGTPRTKDYGILSVFFQLYTDPTILFEVSPNAFFPKPKVTSAVVRLIPLRSPRFPLPDEETFRLMVRFVFGQRRKTLRNSLGAFCERTGRSLPNTPDLKRRPEELTVEELVGLAGLLTGPSA